MVVFSEMLALKDSSSNCTVVFIVFTWPFGDDAFAHTGQLDETPLINFTSRILLIQVSPAARDNVESKVSRAVYLGQQTRQHIQPFCKADQ